jgi:hypothetical protein
VDLPDEGAAWLRRADREGGHETFSGHHTNVKDARKTCSTNKHTVWDSDNSVFRRVRARCGGFGQCRCHYSPVRGKTSVIGHPSNSGQTKKESPRRQGRAPRADPPSYRHAWHGDGESMHVNSKTEKSFTGDENDFALPHVRASLTCTFCKLPRWQGRARRGVEAATY